MIFSPGVFFSSFPIFLFIFFDFLISLFASSRSLHLFPSSSFLALSQDTELKKKPNSAMYPKPLMDLAGWNVHSLASGGTTFAAAASSTIAPNTPNERTERQTVTWGHALHGELGYGVGGKKSSANPDVVPALVGAKTLQVSMGSAHSLFLVERGHPAVEALEVWSPQAPDLEEAPAFGAAGGTEDGGGGGGGGGGKGIKRKGGVAPAAVRGRGRPAGRGRGRGRK